MEIVFQTFVANALVAVVLAILVAVFTRAFRHPPLAHFLWLLVLLKLVTPPLFNVEIPISITAPVTADSAAGRTSVPRTDSAASVGRETAQAGRPTDLDAPETGREGERRAAQSGCHAALTSIRRCWSRRHNLPTFPRHGQPGGKCRCRGSVARTTGRGRQPVGAGFGGTVVVAAAVVHRRLDLVDWQCPLVHSRGRAGNAIRAMPPAGRTCPGLASGGSPPVGPAARTGGCPRFAWSMVAFRRFSGR